MAFICGLTPTHLLVELQEKAVYKIYAPIQSAAASPLPADETVQLSDKQHSVKCDKNIVSYECQSCSFVPFRILPA